MSEEAEKKLDILIEEMKEVKAFISKRDKVTNHEYCRLRQIAYPTLLGWFKKGCPREDSRNVSIKAIDEWARDNNTRKSKNK